MTQEKGKEVEPATAEDLAPADESKPPAAQVISLDPGTELLKFGQDALAVAKERNRQEQEVSIETIQAETKRHERAHQTVERALFAILVAIILGLATTLIVVLVKPDQADKFIELVKTVGVVALAALAGGKVFDLVKSATAKE